MTTQALTLFHKIWNSHVVAQQPDSPAVLYVDLHLVHEVTSPQAFTGLRTMDAQKETEQPRTFGGHGTDTDIIVASAKAYLSAVNKLLVASGAGAGGGEDVEERTEELGVMLVV